MTRRLSEMILEPTSPIATPQQVARELAQKIVGDGPRWKGQISDLDIELLIDRITTALEATAKERDAERDEIVNAVLRRVGKRWRSMSIEAAASADINGATAAIVADQPGAALVAVNMALDHLTKSAREAGWQEGYSGALAAVRTFGIEKVTELEIAAEAAIATEPEQ